MIEKEEAVEEQYREKLYAIGKVLDEVLGLSVSKIGWTVLMFPLESGDGRMNYLSNAVREDMLIAMKEFIAANEGRKMEEPKTEQ